MRLITLLLLAFVSIMANDMAHKFALSEECKACHVEIYEEFVGSTHFNATPQKDPIHKAVWDKHPQNTQQKRYACGKCHTPAADDLDKMMAKGETAMPDANNPTHQEAIGCAYCHRIESVELHKQSNVNVISKDEKKYFGTREEHIDSPFHEIATDANQIMKNGNVCAGCHSHKMNSHGVNVCSTNIANEMDGANCVSCHMPKVDGTVSNMKERKQHTFHGFAGSHYNSQMLSKYVDISLLREIDDFVVNVDNRTSHVLLLHPLRMAVLKVSVTRGEQTSKMKNEIFVRVIGHDGKPAMPWAATTTLKDTMIKANEKRAVKYDFKLQSGDRVDVVLGWFLVNPKAVEKLGLRNEEVATKFIEFKKQSFTF
jgi:hypothetical protein